ncbi:MAG: hypothetical protein H7318_19660 [Oligoflexus sp.]|nr:hypothetical protein [Oligoflexus sp.]
MTMKLVLCSFAALAVLGTSCSESKTFSGTPASAESPKKTLNAEPAKPVPVPVTLQLVLPSNEIRSGLKTLQASVVISGMTKSKVIWKIESPVGIDAGSIDANGLYTSPAVLAAEEEVTISASLADEPSIQDSDKVKVVPADQIFVGCAAGSQIFPIVAEVFKLPSNTQKLPDFSTIQADKSTTVCMDQYHVPVRNFNDGFPGVPELREWFALHTTGKIMIPNAGLYKFRLKSDDGSVLYIDSKIVVNNDGQHSPKPVDGSLELTAGAHEMVLDYFQGPADQIALELFWQVPGSTEWIIVPSNVFQK